MGVPAGRFPLPVVRILVTHNDQGTRDRRRRRAPQGGAAAIEGIERPAVIQALAEARSHGICQRTPTDAAKERQGFLEGRISEVESKLAHAQVIDPSAIEADGRVVFGSTVEIEDLENGTRTVPDRRRRRSRHQGQQDLRQFADRAR
jgi:hypothetical protein